MINIKTQIFAVFWPSILKRPYLLTTKLRCLQEKNFGHTLSTHVEAFLFV